MNAVFELRGLPVGAVASNLTDEVQIAVEPVEPARAQRRRNLPLQAGFRVIVRTAMCFGYGPETFFGRIVIRGFT